MHAVLGLRKWSYMHYMVTEFSSSFWVGSITKREHLEKTEGREGVKREKSVYFRLSLPRVAISWLHHSVRDSSFQHNAPTTFSAITWLASTPPQVPQHRRNFRFFFIKPQGMSKLGPAQHLLRPKCWDSDSLSINDDSVTWPLLYSLAVDNWRCKVLTLGSFQ